MNRTSIVIATGCLSLAMLALWLWLRPAAPIGAPVFNWKHGDRYELVVSTPEMGSTAPALQAGAQRIRVRPPQPPRYSSAVVSNP